jgi:hypothetical protein
MGDVYKFKLKYVMATSPCAGFEIVISKAIVYLQTSTAQIHPGIFGISCGLKHNGHMDE